MLDALLLTVHLERRTAMKFRALILLSIVVFTANGKSFPPSASPLPKWGEAKRLPPMGKMFVCRQGGILGRYPLLLGVASNGPATVVWAL